MTTTTTPAMELAGKLTAIAEHLRAHPELPNVNISGRGAELQTATYPHKGEPEGPQSVLLWAKSFGESASIELSVHGDPKNRATMVEVTGDCAGQTVRVWNVDYCELHRLTLSGTETAISVAQLAEYVAAGTVEGLGAR